MSDAASIFLAGVGFLVLLGLGAFAVISLREGERRAARVSAGLGLACAAPVLAVAVLPPPLPALGAALVLIFGIGAVALVLFSASRVPSTGGRPSQRVDERDIMFARGRLVPGSNEYELSLIHI